MHMGIRTGFVVFGLIGCLAGCSSGSDTRDLANAAIDAMGGNAVRALTHYTMKDGTGSRSRLGQVVRTGQGDPIGKLSRVTETYDLANGRAALDYEILAGNGFSQHRQEILTRKGDRGVGLENVGMRPLAVMSPSGLFSWGTQNSPTMAMRRNVIAILRAAADSTSTAPAQERTLNGRQYQFANAMIDDEEIGMYFDPETDLLSAFEATDTETMLGDQPAVYLLSDYREVGGVRLPHEITIRKGGEHYADVKFASATVNDPDALTVFNIPDAVTPEVDRAIAAGTDYSPITLTRVAEGLYFAQAYSHNSLVVEFPTFLAVVEAPYTEAQSKTLAHRLSEMFKNKPIRYAVVTHPHFDHTGGVRGIAAQGATIVAAREHEGQLRALLDARHTNPPDELSSRRTASQRTGTLEVFEGKMTISEGAQRLDLHTITGSPHVDAMVIAYVPSSRVLFQSDLFFPGTGAPATPEAAHLLQSVRMLNLRVDKNAGGHGGFDDFAELVRAVSKSGSN
jgi:glyoxylase-like metal-dependent hydrolase (beta-lactamase superfamily II)